MQNKMMKKTWMILFLLFLSAPSWAGLDDDEDCEGCSQVLEQSLNLKKEKPFVQAKVFYIGSPVDQRRLLEISAECGTMPTKVVYELKECEFADVKLEGQELSFKTLLYNPDNGRCDRTTKKHKLSLKSLCDKPQLLD